MSTSHHLALSVAGPVDFDVRDFTVHEAVSEPYRVELEVTCPDPGVDLDALVGATACFELQRVFAMVRRRWRGIVTRIEQVDVDEVLSTYRLVIAPRLWLLTQRRQYRVFQQKSDPDVVCEILAGWGIEPDCRYDRPLYLGRKYRVQYAETDYVFVSRLLEDSGITFFFEDPEDEDQESKLVLCDAPHQAAARKPSLPFEPQPAGELEHEFVNHIEVTRRLRPGRYTQRDVDWRQRPEVPLVASDSVAGPEARLERFHLDYGAFLYAARPTGDTPVADDRGAARVNLDVGRRQVSRRLAAKRADARRCTFRTNAHDVAPGRIVTISHHPRSDLAESVGWLVVAGRLAGNALGEWTHEAEAVPSAVPYHPPLTTSKPTTKGLESATVVGPPGDEIHCDELARVRVQFHWDREGRRDGGSSCWIPVNQPWGGSGFGAVNLPRVGQEVLVDFLGEDPDRPVIVGRVYTVTNPVPYALPQHKTVSGIRSETANHPIKQLLQKALSEGANGLAGAVGDAAGAAVANAVGDALPGRLGEVVGQQLGSMASNALGGAVSDALGGAFGPSEPPLGSLIPDVAGMLARMPKPSGAPFVAANDAGATTDGAPSGPPVATSAPPRAIARTVTVQPPHLAPPPDDSPPPIPPDRYVVGGSEDFVAAPEAFGGAATPTLPETPAVGELPHLADTPPLPTSPLPEIPMGMERLEEAQAAGFGAFSPGDQTHHWLGSEVTMDDTFGRERLYVQAQRNHHLVVKHSERTVVGAGRRTKVGTSDVLDVGHQQVTRTGAHRGVDVYGNQAHIVKGNITQLSVEASQTFTAPEAITTTAKTLVMVGEELYAADIGGPPPPPPGMWKISGLVMRPDHVILDTPALFLNPGEEALAEALATGRAPESAPETQAKVAAAELAAKQAQVAEARGVYENAWSRGELSNAYDAIDSGLHADVERRYGRDVRVEAWGGFMEDHMDGDPMQTIGMPTFDQPETPAKTE